MAQFDKNKLTTEVHVGVPVHFKWLEQDGIKFEYAEYDKTARAWMSEPQELDENILRELGIVK